MERMHNAHSVERRVMLSLDEGHDNNKGKYDDGIFHDGGSVVNCPT